MAIVNLDETTRQPWTAPIAPVGSAGGGGGVEYGVKPFDVAGAYRNILGRDPDANELSSDTENLGKYGAAQLATNLRERAASNNLGRSSGLPANQFDDAYTSMLENIAKAQMGQVRSNPGLDSLMGFLNQRFQELSTQPGYSTGEQAMLNTQAFEPIEANRQASIQRARERAAARGFAPSSGLMELDIRDIERGADTQRTLANRDLAIAGLNRRDQDLGQALNIGQLLGLQIPGSQRAEELGLANILYQLPRTAMQDAMAIVNGSGSGNDLFTQILAMTQANRQNQQYNDLNNAALIQEIGKIIAAGIGR